MGLIVSQLNQKYQVEDKLWDFNLFPKWLGKHGIPDTSEIPVVRVTLEQVLLEWELDKLPEKHHDFDRAVLALAENNKAKITNKVGELVESMIAESLKKHLGGNRWGKALRAIRGKL